MIRALAISLCLALHGVAVAQCETWWLDEPVGDVGPGFGSRTAWDCDVLLVGDTSSSGEHVESIWIFRRDPHGWSVVDRIVNPGRRGNQFGVDLDVDGNTLVVAAPSEFPDDFLGAIYIFTRSRRDGAWTLAQLLESPTLESSSGFGRHAAVHGDVVAAGARSAVVGGEAFAGSVYIFRRTRSTWTYDSTLTAPTPRAWDLFGAEVGLDDDRVAVGAPFRGPGAAFVFEGDVATEIVASPLSSGAQFGHSLELAGDHLIVGAPQNHVAGITTGSAFVFARRAGEWLQQSHVHPAGVSGGDNFGADVALTERGDVALIAAPAATPGVLRVLQRDGTIWEVISVMEFDTAISELPVSISPTGPGAASARGAALVFERLETACASIADIDANGVVDADDLQLLLLHWGVCEPCSHCVPDLDSDRSVGVSDLLLLLKNWSHA